jgi:hypothetical protein
MNLNPKSLALLDTIAREYAKENTLRYFKFAEEEILKHRLPFGQLRRWSLLSWGAFPLPDRFIANRYGHYVSRWYDLPYGVRPLPGKLEGYARYWERVAEVERLRFGLNYPVEYWVSQEVRNLVAKDSDAAYDLLQGEYESAKAVFDTASEWSPEFDAAYHHLERNSRDSDYDRDIRYGTLRLQAGLDLNVYYSLFNLPLAEFILWRMKTYGYRPGIREVGTRESWSYRKGEDLRFDEICEEIFTILEETR